MALDTSWKVSNKRPCNTRTLLRQSPLLFQAYSEEFGVSNVFEGDDSVDFQLLLQWGRDYDDAKEAQIFHEAVKGLEAKERRAPVPRAVFAEGLDTAFAAVFMDTHDMVSYYAHELQRLWKAWFKNPTQHIAPYTSIVTSSMMGKSKHSKTC